jgi:large subunit ribosomal protein L22e
MASSKKVRVSVAVGVCLAHRPRATEQSRAAGANRQAATGKVATYTISCEKPAGDGIFDVAAFENFMQDRFKVHGKTGNLGTAVTIARDGSSIVVKSSGAVAFPKKYLKYLTKKFLKKNQLRDWLHVIANDKLSYELRYFNINQDEEEEAAASDAGSDDE